MPIIETQVGDVSAFVPTNVISITDGQIFWKLPCSTLVFVQRLTPGISVSRVGGAAQTKVIKTCPVVSVLTWRSIVNWQRLRSSLLIWMKQPAKQLDRGARVTELLKQAQYAPLPISLMAASLYAVNKGFLDDVPEKVLAFESGMHNHLKTNQAALLQRSKKPNKWTKMARLPWLPQLLISKIRRLLIYRS